MTTPLPKRTREQILADILQTEDDLTSWNDLSPAFQERVIEAADYVRDEYGTQRLADIGTILVFGF